jgi:hypothetical protein
VITVPGWTLLAAAAAGLLTLLAALALETRRAHPRPRWCKCGHGWPAHIHNREGTDCGICSDCPRFRRAWLRRKARTP